MPCLNTYGPNNEQRTCKPRKENPLLCEHRGLSSVDHHVKCAIQWIDGSGNPTPDYNDAIGVCYIEPYSYTDPHGVHRRVPGSKHFPICAEHAKRFETYPERERLRGAHWVFILLTQYIAPESQ